MAKKGPGGENKLQLVGERFGKLVVVKEVPSQNGKNSYWKTICDCGNTHVSNSDYLRNGGTKSCGCLRQDYKNRKRNSNNKSGITGVSWDKKNKKWFPTIGHQNKQIYLGRFNDLEKAIEARQEAERKYSKNN